MTSLTKATRSLLQWSLAVLLALSGTATLRAQATAAAHQSGTVKTANPDGFVLTTPAGQDVTVSVPTAAKVLIVPPGSHDLSGATAGSLSDVQPGDRALVTGAAGETGSALTAGRVILMKSTAIAQTHAAEEAAWARGGGGIVKSVNPAENIITISSGLRTVTVKLQSSTVIRRYSGDSVRFEDAKPSTLAEIRPGDQLRVRGTRSADGSAVSADEIVTGTFRNYSGLLSAVDPSTGTVTLKDLATGKTVTVAVTSNSDVRRLPPMAAQMIAGRLRGAANGAAATGGGRTATGNAGGSSTTSEQAGPRGAGPGAPGGTPEQGGAAAGARRAGTDLSQMLSRLPTETITELKPGEAVMIVASSPSAESSHSSAVTLLSGVEPILSASPSGQTMTLSPWSVGGSADAGMAGDGAAGPGR